MHPRHFYFINNYAIGCQLDVRTLVILQMLLISGHCAALKKRSKQNKNVANIALLASNTWDCPLNVRIFH